MLVQVATDLFASKLNFLLEFPANVTIPELQARAEGIFSREMEIRRPSSVPPMPFRTDHMQIFDAASGGWVELTTPAQLFSGCQVYIFQPPSKWHNDAQGGLPPAIRPPASPTASSRLSPPPIPTMSPVPAADPVSAVKKEAAARAGLLLGELVETT
eukprot:Sspe_Gene.102814::Locus_78650_Transcript_1_1_Confidence_1.000_Length_565::g.102814::m.102814